MKRKPNWKRALRVRLAKKQKRRCYYCGCRVTLRVFGQQEPLTPDAATIEHIIPLSKGGSYHPDNLVMACHACNNRRSDGDARDEILRAMGLLRGE